MQYLLHCIFPDTILIGQLEAAAVNLVAGDHPADVYSEIAAKYVHMIDMQIFIMLWIFISDYAYRLLGQYVALLP